MSETLWLCSSIFCCRPASCCRWCSGFPQVTNSYKGQRTPRGYPPPTYSVALAWFYVHFCDHVFWNSSGVITTLGSQYYPVISIRDPISVLPLGLRSSGAFPVIPLTPLDADHCLRILGPQLSSRPECALPCVSSCGTVSNGSVWIGSRT